MPSCRVIMWRKDQRPVQRVPVLGYSSLYNGTAERERRRM